MSTRERQGVLDTHGKIETETSRGRFSKAEEIVVGTIYDVCVQNGAMAVVRGGILDRCLLERFGLDPSRLDRAKEALQMVSIYENKPDDNSISFCPGSTDIKILNGEKGSNVFDNIYQQLSKRLSYLLDKIDDSSQSLTLTRSWVAENTEIPIINLSLMLDTDGESIPLNRINIVETPPSQDRRLELSAFNLDAIYAYIGTLDQALVEDPDYFFRQPGSRFRPFPHCFSPPCLILPELPSEASLSEKAFRHYLDGIDLLDPHSINGIGEIAGRGIRKTITFDLPVEEATTLRVAELMRQVEAVWSKVSHNEHLLRKTARELEVSAVLDPMRALGLMKDFEIWRLLANEQVRHIFSDEDKYRQVEGVLKRILMNRNKIGLQHPWLPPNLFAFRTAMSEVANVNLEENSIFELRR